jgi:hypothetical protein
LLMSRAVTLGEWGTRPTSPAPLHDWNKGPCPLVLIPDISWPAPSRVPSVRLTELMVQVEPGCPQQHRWVWRSLYLSCPWGFLEPSSLGHRHPQTCSHSEPDRGPLRLRAGGVIPVSRLPYPDVQVPVPACHGDPLWVCSKAHLTEVQLLSATCHLSPSLHLLLFSPHRLCSFLGVVHLPPPNRMANS